MQTDDQARWLTFPLRMFYLGLIIRLLLMPFAVHSDFIHTWWASSCIRQGTPVPLHLQSLLFSLHAAYLQIVSPLLPSNAAWCGTFYGLAADNASFVDWYNFITQPQVFRALFVLKLPYLAFDLACGLLIFSLGANARRSAWMFNFWWLNPITIYSIYVIGRHESITIFFILLSFWCIKHSKLGLAYLLLGVAVALRYYPLFLLPFYLFSLPANIKEQAKRLGLAFLPWLLVNLWVLSGRGDTELISFVNYPYDRYLLPLHLPVADWDNIYLFPLAYFILLLHRIYNSARGQQSLFQYSLMAILLLQALTYMGQAPHYWIWFVPFMSLIFEAEDRILPLHAAQVITLLMYGMIGARATAGYLFASISPDFFWSLSSPIEWIQKLAPAELAISMSHTAFTAITLWILFIVYQKMDVRLIFRGQVS